MVLQLQTIPAMRAPEPFASKIILLEESKKLPVGSIPVMNKENDKGQRRMNNDF